MPLHVTARLLPLDDTGRILLAKYLDDGMEHDQPYWATIGGHIESGETLAEAAIREAKEETGLDVELGPAVWYAEHEFKIAGTLFRFQETFFAAKLSDGSMARDGWTPIERKVLKDLRWWTVAEIMTTEELIFPTSLALHLPAIVRGEYPEKPITIEA